MKKTGLLLLYLVPLAVVYPVVYSKETIRRNWRYPGNEDWNHPQRTTSKHIHMLLVLLTICFCYLWMWGRREVKVFNLIKVGFEKI